MSRERIFTEAGITPIYAPGFYKSGDTFYSLNGGATYYPDYCRVGMVDVVSSNFHARRRSGELINNPMWFLSHNLRQKPSLYRGSGQCQRFDSYELGITYPPEYPVLGSLQSAVDIICDQYKSEASIAEAQAWANIDVSAIQGSTSLGEMPETVKFLIDALKSVLSLTIAAKRGDWKTIARSAKKTGMTVDGLANLWLGYRYAVRPLVKDVQDALKAIAKTLEVGTRFTARGKFKTSEYRVCSSFTGWKPDATSEERLDGNVIRSTARSYRAGVLVEIDRAIDATAAIWGLDNPLEAVWQLVPCSFIFDWIFNIGECINAALMNPSLSPRCSFLTAKIEYSQEVTITRGYTTTAHCNASTVHREFFQLGYTNQYITAKRRVPTVGQFNLPTLRLKLNATKLLDIILIARKLI